MLKVEVSEKVDMSKYGKNTKCIVHRIHIKVHNVKDCSQEIIRIVTDKSWIAALDVIDKAAYESRANKTIEKLVEGVLKKVTTKVTEDFGEYLISFVAQEILATSFNHGKVPLAELFKEKLSNNMGFDFHTESQNKIIIYGESKYSGKKNPYSNAIDQIVDFIAKEKDVGELVHVRKFVSQGASENAIKKIKGYVAAFSLNSNKPMAVLEKAVKLGSLDKLLGYTELYLIGIEINA